MSIVGIFTTAQPSIHNVAFDATLEEVTELTAEVTEFPIENGSIGNDHAVIRPLKLVMRVGISDNPVRALARETRGLSPLIGIGAGSAVAELEELAAAAGLGFSLVNAAFTAGRAATRSQSALDAVRELQRSLSLFNVVTLKRQYKGCLITSTYQETTPENEQGLELVVEMQEMLIINSRINKAKTPALEDTAQTQAQETTNLGRLGLQE